MVVEHVADTLRIRAPWSPPDQLIAVSDLARIDVRTGTDRNTFRGLGWGVLSGAAVGAVWGLLATDTGSDLVLGERIAYTAALIGGVGGIIGAVVGSFSRHDVWQRVRLGAPRFDFGWRDGGLQLRAAVALPAALK